MVRIRLFENFDRQEFRTVYHGTSRRFVNLRLDAEASNPVYGTDAPDRGLGVFFTDNLVMAAWFAGIVDFDPDEGDYVRTGQAGRVLSASLSVKRPWVLQEHVDDIDQDDPGQTYFETVERMGGGERMRELLSDQGYDCVVVHGMTTNYYRDGSYSIYVLFDPSDAIIIDGDLDMPRDI